MKKKWVEGSILTGFFLLELVAFAAFSYWGYHINAGAAEKIIFAILTPLVVATFWGVFLSPKASLPIFSFPLRTSFKLALFIIASGALYASGRGVLGIALLTVSFLVVAAIFILKLHRGIE